MCVTDGLPEVGRGGGGPSAEADHRRRLSGVPCRALLRQAGALRYPSPSSLSSFVSIN